MSRRLAVASALAAALLAGCGGSSGDLLALEVSGGPAGTKRQIVVITEDGHGSCNRGARHKITSAQVIDAREVEREAGDLATKGTDIQASRPGARQYVLREKAGTVRWTEGLGLPPELAKATLFATGITRAVCGSG
ncbi:MAG: hypothetical protein QOE08_2006 [Thermoleophilaceae bacterium]|jgi:hypothetical protein|nr:hypothetical protein [Thermoleophilaceae bacterium]